MGKPIAVSESEFEKEVLQSDKPTIVDFWAEWCGPCKMLAPVLEAVGEQMGDKLKVVKVDTDQNQDLAAKYRVSAIPTLILFKGGEEKERIVGFLSEKELLSKLEPHL